MTTETEVSIVCVVAICRECREAVIYKYIKESVSPNPVTPSSMVMTTGFPVGSGFGFIPKPTIEWCPCGSDEPRFLCRVTNEELPGLEDKCEKCEFRFACASSRIEIVYEGAK